MERLKHYLIKLKEVFKDFLKFEKMDMVTCILVCVVVFILTKMFHQEWYVILICSIVLTILFPKFSKQEWTVKLLKNKLFQSYLNIMLEFESEFLAISFIQLWFLGFFISLWIFKLKLFENYYFEILFLLSSLMFTIYYRLRLNYLSINDIAYDTKNIIHSSQLEEHFYKITGVRIRLSGDRYVLFGIPKNLNNSKRTMFSAARKILAGFSNRAIAFISSAAGGYVAHALDTAAKERNARSIERIKTLETKRDNIYDSFSNKKSNLTPEQINEIMSRYHKTQDDIDHLNSYANYRDLPGLRIFQTPLPQDSNFNQQANSVTDQLNEINRIINSNKPKDVSYIIDFDKLLDMLSIFI